MADLWHRKEMVGNSWKWRAAIVVRDRLGGEGLSEGIFDSEEEVLVLRWLEEAFGAGYVSAYQRGKTYKLFDAVVIHGDYDKVSRRKAVPQLVPTVKSRTLLRERMYTPDFEFVPTAKFYTDFLSGKEQSEKLAGFLGIRDPRDEKAKLVVVDVKGDYVLADRKEEFNLKRHVMYKVHGIPVIELDPAMLFALTWVPRAAAYTQKTGKRVNKFAALPLLGEESKSGSAILPDVVLC